MKGSLTSLNLFLTNLRFRRRNHSSTKTLITAEIPCLITRSTMAMKSISLETFAKGVDVAARFSRMPKSRLFARRLDLSQTKREKKNSGANAIFPVARAISTVKPSKAVLRI